MSALPASRRFAARAARLHPATAASNAVARLDETDRLERTLAAMRLDGCEEPPAPPAPRPLMGLVMLAAAFVAGVCACAAVVAFI